MGCIACFAFLAVYMSDRVDSFSVPPSFDVDFDVPPYWSLACRGQSYARAKIGIPFVIMEYVYLKYMDGQMADVHGYRGKKVKCTRDLL